MARRRTPRPAPAEIRGPDAEGRYYGYLVVGTRPDGSPDRKRRSGRSPDEVARKLRRLEEQLIRDGRVTSGRSMTVQAWCEHWLTTILPARRRNGRPPAPSTLYDYRTKAARWIYPHIGGYALEALDTEHLDTLYAAASRELAPASVLKLHSIISGCLTAAVRRKRIPYNVAKLMDPPGAPSKRRDNAPTADEARRLIEAALRRRNGVRWVLAASIGPRQGEVLGLRWRHVDLDAGEVEISWQLQRQTWRHGCDDPAACAARHCRTAPCPPGWSHGCDDPTRCRTRARFCPARVPGPCARHPKARACPPVCPAGCTGHARACPARVDGGLVLRPPKGWKTRTVGIPPALVELLLQHRDRQGAERRAAGSVWGERPLRTHEGDLVDDLVFTDELGRPVHANADRAELVEICREAGVDPRVPHDTRHGAATTLLELGVDITTVAEILGHSDLRITQGYARVRTESTRRAADRISAALLPGSEPDLNHGQGGAVAAGGTVIPFPGRSRRSQGRRSHGV